MLKMDLHKLPIYEASYFTLQTKESFKIDNIEYDDTQLIARVFIEPLTHDKHLTAVLSIAIASYLEVIYVGLISGEPKDRQLIQTNLSIHCNKPIYPENNAVRFLISIENITISRKFTAYDFLFDINNSFSGKSQILRPLDKSFSFKRTQREKHVA